MLFHPGGAAAWNTAGSNKTMSQKTVQAIVGRLLTDEEFRLDFLRHPQATLATMRDQGLELTAREIEALVRTDRTLWTDGAARIDPQLQRASFRRD